MSGSDSNKVLSANSRLARLGFGVCLLLIVLSVRLYALIIDTTKVQVKVLGFWHSKEAYIKSQSESFKILLSVSDDDNGGIDYSKEEPFDTSLHGMNSFSNNAFSSKYDAKAHESEQVLFEDVLITFSFKELVSDFWDAGAYMMSMLIVIGSCVVPITSIIFLLGFLYHELYHISNDLGTRRRKLWFRRLFFTFETISCAALVDLIFQSYVQIILGNEVVLIKNFFAEGKPPLVAVSIAANPQTGIAVGVGCTLALMCCFPLIEYITPTQRSSNPNPNEYSMESRLLEDECMDEDEHFSTDEPAILLKEYASMYSRPLFVYIAFAVTSIMCIVATLMTWVSLLVQFRLEGLTGLVVGKVDGKKDFKPLYVAHDLQTTGSGDPGIPDFLGFIYEVVVVIIPSIVVILSVLSCIVPLTNSKRTTMLSVVKGLFTFSGFDILFIASIAAYIEMPLVADWVFDDQFHNLCRLLDRIAGEECISLEKKLGDGMSWLIVAVMLQAIVVIFAHLAHLKIRLNVQVRQ